MDVGGRHELARAHGISLPSGGEKATVFHVAGPITRGDPTIWGQIYEIGKSLFLTPRMNCGTSGAFTFSPVAR